MHVYKFIRAQLLNKKAVIYATGDNDNVSLILQRIQKSKVFEEGEIENLVESGALTVINVNDQLSLPLKNSNQERRVSKPEFLIEEKLRSIIFKIQQKRKFQNFVVILANTTTYSIIHSNLEKLLDFEKAIITTVEKEKSKKKKKT